MGFDVISFGESLIRISPPGPGVFEQTGSLRIYPAGSELNTAIAAARLGLKVSYVTKVANNPLGRVIINRCREHGVDTSWIAKSDTHRQGLLFFENAQAPRPGVAYYDREHSVFSHISMDDFHWTEILSQTRIFLLSGINPALSQNAHNVCLHAVQTAKAQGKIVAFDTNYRSKLWTAAKAQETLQSYYPYIDILFLSGGDARTLFGLTSLPGDRLAQKLSKDLGIPTVVLVHSSGNSDALWRITCVSQGRVVAQDQFGKLNGVERLGAGDALAGGFLTGYLESGIDLGVRLGNASMTLKNTYVGDFSWITRDLVDQYLSGDVETLKR